MQLACGRSWPLSEWMSFGVLVVLVCVYLGCDLQAALLAARWCWSLWAACLWCFVVLMSGIGGQQHLRAEGAASLWQVMAIR